MTLPLVMTIADHAARQQARPIKTPMFQTAWVVQFSAYPTLDEEFWQPVSGGYESREMAEAHRRRVSTSNVGSKYYRVREVMIINGRAVRE